MSETKQESNLSLIWELVLYIILIFSIVGLPFLNGHYYSYSDTSQVFLFRKNNSVFWGQEFKGVVNSYFIISLILLILLPVIAYFIHDSFEKKGYPFLASLQSFLIYLSCSVILIYAAFSLTIQKVYYNLGFGVYLCLLIYMVHMYSDLKDLRKIIEQRNSSTVENQVEE
ncbi:hypothetical protein D8866_00350 [Streptococcus parasanguinis]|uniref:hypothetical protein n=1 Tax=Streptococcus parasanguinis TaxID=1318 RepID=UPI000F78D005|nr:hypothetical protein [Streptococcus parasanguinis]MCP8990735.1 hypothetical protein [Streptococcus parasanguinis]MCP8992640.1 hypothetical protein [Streptococcus parasanguinis]MCP9003780.1 hypothetical protein [Streptococcus parasanguinis]MCP9009785.1 hypothetical protein [Streptococcus parasanguinis]MCP9034408.1 hypothetical protein [Streptococcus parasanguinis]